MKVRTFFYIYKTYKMRKYILLFFALMLVSCNKDIIHDSFTTDFVANRWISDNEQSFEFTIPEDGTYTIDLHFGHIYDFQFATIPLEITFLNEKRIIQQETLNLQINNDKGESLASCSGDVCDLYQSIAKEIIIKRGKYSVNVKNKFPSAYLPNILGVGIRVTKGSLSN